MNNKGKTYFQGLLGLGLVLVILVGVNVISSNLFFRMDATQESLYSLSDGTKSILKNLKEPVHLKFYFTKSAAGVPLTYKNYGQKIHELLAEYQAVNPNQIRLEIFDPKPDSDEEEWAKKYGLSTLDLGNGESFIMGLVVTRADKEVAIAILDPRRERFLEYDVTQMVLQASQDKEMVIGVMSSIPVLGIQPDQMQRLRGAQEQPKWALFQELEKNFELKTIDPNQPEIEDRVKVMMVIHPKHLSEQAQYALDQFVLRGGELIVLVDPSARADVTAARMAQMGQPAEATSDLPKLFKHWGIEYQPGKILGDNHRATQVNTGEGIVAFSLWQTLDKSAFNQEVIATRQLEQMLMIEPGAFALAKTSPLKLTPLITPGAEAGFVDAFLLRFTPPLELNSKLEKSQPGLTMAGLLTGPLTSAFAQAPKVETKQGEKAPVPRPHLAKSEKNARILLVADVDFIADPFAVNQIQVLGQILSQPKNDNLAFVANLVEFLGGAEEMMGIRTRGRFSRPFTRFAELEAQAQGKYRAAEERIQQKLKEVQSRLSQLQVKEGEVVLTKEQVEQIKQFREEEKTTKSELRNIRKLLRQDIEQEKTFLTLLNLLLVPLALALFGLVLYLRRFRQPQTNQR